MIWVRKRATTRTKAAVLAAIAVPISQAFLTPLSPVNVLRNGWQDWKFASPGVRRMASGGMAMGIAAPDDDARVVVCGPREGLAGLVATRLSTAGGTRQVMMAEESMTLPDQLKGAKVVVATSDGGPDGEEAPPRFAEEIANAISPTTEYLIWVDTPEGRAATKEAKAEVGLFGRLTGQGFKAPLEVVRGVEGNVKCIIMHTGRLFGAAGGEEPVPFMTGPKAEPVLDKSITRQAVLLGPGTILSASETAATKRSSVAEAIERILESAEGRAGLEISVVSVEGPATSDEEWNEELKRLDDTSGVAVFSIDFESIPKKDQLLGWMADSWGPTALRTSKAAMLRSGARPVALKRRADGIDVLWETLTKDLDPIEAGRLCINIVEEPNAGIRVIRVAGPGQPQGITLSGEEEMAQSLLEGINTVAYPKAFVTRKLQRAKAQQRAKPVIAGVEGGAATTEGSAVGAIGAGLGTSRETSVVETGTAAETSTPSPSPSTDVGSKEAAAARKGRGRRSGGKLK